MISRIGTLGFPAAMKLWAALTLNRQGWLTRHAGTRVLGQAEIGVSANAR